MASVISGANMIVGHKAFHRQPMTSFIVGTRRDNHPGHVTNLDVIISAEARTLASQSTPLQKLASGPTTALKR